MDTGDYIMLGVVLLLGSMIQSAAGFAFGLFAIPLVLLTTDVEPFAAIVTISTCSLLQSAFGLTTARGHVHWRTLMPLILCAMLLQPIGVWLLYEARQLGEEHIRQIFGGILLTALAVQWCFKPKPRKRVHPFWGYLAFGLGGFFSGLCGMGGPPMVIWLMAHTWSTKATRAALWLTFLCIGPTNLCYQAYMNGSQVWQWAGLAVLFLPVILLGMPPGIWVGNRMPKARLRQVAFGLLIIIGLWSIVQPFVMPTDPSTEAAPGTDSEINLNPSTARSLMDDPVTSLWPCPDIGGTLEPPNCT